MESSKMLASAKFGGFHGDQVSEELAAAWEAEPRCVECGEPVRSALEAALLVGLDRVTHRERCFVPALVRRHPHLRLLTARGSARETSERQGDAAMRAPDGRSMRSPEAGHG